MMVRPLACEELFHLLFRAGVESGLLVILFNILCLCLFMGIVYHPP